MKNHNMELSFTHETKDTCPDGMFTILGPEGEQIKINADGTFRPAVFPSQSDAEQFLSKMQEKEPIITDIIPVTDDMSIKNHPVLIIHID